VYTDKRTKSNLLPVAKAKSRSELSVTNLVESLLFFWWKEDFMKQLVELLIGILLFPWSPEVLFSSYAS
jgi:hypothetical protein